jgi:release factor glutamine methyltransferase
VATPDLRSDLDGEVDLLVANPPYIPDDAILEAMLEPEVAQHDPPHALFGGPDGMTVIGAVVKLACRWLRHGGLFAVEHDDSTSTPTTELLIGTGHFDNIVARHDLAERPRFVTARRSAQP